MYYVRHGSVPPQRHTQHRSPTGGLYWEELFGVEGFSGRNSLLYHLTPPTQTHRVEAVRDVRLQAADDGLHRHRLIDTSKLGPWGDVVSGRVPLFFNADVTFGVVLPAAPIRNGVADELLYVHEGSGVCDTVFGPLRYAAGDYLVLPIGTTWRLDPDPDVPQRMLYLEAPSEIEPPKRYRNEYGQLLEHSPYYQRDLHPPDEAAPRDETGEFEIQVRTADRITAYHYRHHPFDVVGWDGYLWPFRFSIHDFQPITGRVHQPPPVHQTFGARNFVVCSFVPRKFDYHPLSIPAPYAHSNINSDEVIYYVAGNFMSRRGVGIASFTLHPAGIPHGPHPGTAEASIGREATEELAVMVDTFRPLAITQAAMDMDDGRYPYSWLPPDESEAAREASELAERGPEAFPD
jgi:homogentisate 1,2-dioxygenase